MIRIDEASWLTMVLLAGALALSLVLLARGSSGSRFQLRRKARRGAGDRECGRDPGSRAEQLRGLPAGGAHIPGQRDSAVDLATGKGDFHEDRPCRCQADPARPRLHGDSIQRPLEALRSEDLRRPAGRHLVLGRNQRHRQSHNDTRCGSGLYVAPLQDLGLCLRRGRLGRGTTRSRPIRPGSS